MFRKLAALGVGIATAAALTLVGGAPAQALMGVDDWSSFAKIVQGASGNHVTLWQQLLASELGLKDCKKFVDGKFGPDTLASTLTWQEKLQVDGTKNGVVDGDVWEATRKKLPAPELTNGDENATYTLPKNKTVPKVTISAVSKGNKKYSLSFTSCAGKTVTIDEATEPPKDAGPEQAQSGDTAAPTAKASTADWNKFPVTGKRGDNNVKASSGNIVRLWQSLLVIDQATSQSCDVFVDGFFGKNTKESTKMWQRDNSLKETGIVDAKTWEKAFGTLTKAEEKSIKVAEETAVYTRESLGGKLSVTHKKAAKKAKWTFTSCAGTDLPVTYGKGGTKPGAAPKATTKTDESTKNNDPVATNIKPVSFKCTGVTSEAKEKFQVKVRFNYAKGGKITKPQFQMVGTAGTNVESINVGATVVQSSGIAHNPGFSLTGIPTKSGWQGSPAGQTADLTSDHIALQVTVSAKTKLGAEVACTEDGKAPVDSTKKHTISYPRADLEKQFSEPDNPVKGRWELN